MCQCSGRGRTPITGRAAGAALPVLRRYPATYVSSRLDGFRLRHDFDDVRGFVIFVGQPRTGHSLVGALLDAHPNALIAHELDALKYVAAGYVLQRVELMGDEGVGMGVEEGPDQAVPGARLADEDDEAADGVEVTAQAEPVEPRRHIRGRVAAQHRERAGPPRHPRSPSAHTSNSGTSRSDGEYRGPW